MVMHVEAGVACGGWCCMWRLVLHVEAGGACGGWKCVCLTSVSGKLRMQDKLLNP